MFAQRGWYVGLADIGGGLTNIALALEDKELKTEIRRYIKSLL